MDPFPFTAEEWEEVREVSHSAMNAALADDDVLHASFLAELLALLQQLRARHGEHPVLLETEADFESDPSAALRLYRAAETMAERHGLPTLSIRIALAGLLLDFVNDPDGARAALLACKGELAEADKFDTNEWRELLARCGDC